MAAYGDYLNPTKISRKVLGIKADSMHHVATHNPSIAYPGETLYVRIPKLDKNKVIVPIDVNLRFCYHRSCR